MKRLAFAPRGAVVAVAALALVAASPAAATDSGSSDAWAPESVADHQLLDDAAGSLLAVTVPACGIDAQAVGTVGRAPVDRAAGLLGLACARASLAGVAIHAPPEVTTSTTPTLRRVDRSQWVVHDGALRVDDLDVDGVLVVLGDVEVRGALAVRGALVATGSIVGEGIDVRGSAARGSSVGGVVAADGISADRVGTDGAWLWAGGMDALEGAPASGQLRIASRADLDHSTVDAGRGVIATSVEAQVNVVNTHLFAEQIAASDVLLDRAVVDGLVRVASDRLRVEQSRVGGAHVLLAAAELGELVATVVSAGRVELTGRFWDIDRRSVVETTGHGTCQGSGGPIEVRVAALALDGVLRSDAVEADPVALSTAERCAPEAGSIALTIASALTGSGQVSAQGPSPGRVIWSVDEASGWGGEVIGDVVGDVVGAALGDRQPTPSGD